MGDDRDYAVVWNDENRPLPTAGKLLLIDHHVILIANTPGEPRLVEFEHDEVEAIEIIRSPDARLNDRPTLAIALRDGTVLHIRELGRFGALAEIADAIAA
jgi:hypothetical protein